MIIAVPVPLVIIDIRVCITSGTSDSPFPTINSQKSQIAISTYFQIASTVALLSHPFGTVYCLFALDSYVTLLLLSTLMNLYSKLVPAGRLIVLVHSGFAAVYCAADSVAALAVFQLPSCEMDPAILTVWPNDVVVLELKVTATDATGVAQPAAAVVDEVLDDVAMDEVAGLLEVVGGGFVVPEPVILMSAHVR